MNGRKISAETSALFEKRIKTFNKQKLTSHERKKSNDKIKRTCRTDYRNWVARWIDKIEEADNRGDLRTVFKVTKAVSGTNGSFASKQPTTTAAGLKIQNPVELRKKVLADPARNVADGIRPTTRG